MSLAIVRISRTLALLLFLASYPTRYFAQGSNPVDEGSKRGETPAPPVTGCYELTLGRWWPWAFGEDTGFVTPPRRIQLLSERGAEGFEKGEFLIRSFPLANQTAGLGGPSYWRVKTDNQIDLIWNDGHTGVILTMEKHGDDLRGWAHPHFDAPVFVPHVARVTAHRIACNVPR
jgi:hypothetical protein